MNTCSFVSRPLDLDGCWQSYKVAARHHYRPSDYDLWCDTIRLLEQCGKDIHNAKYICPQDLKAVEQCGKDIHNAKYICPQDLKAAHDRWLDKRNKMEEKRRDREQMLRAKAREADFYREKSRFFGIVISDNDIEISVLDSLEAFQTEGSSLHHCVFQCEYYAKADSVILSAHDRQGNRIETVEFSLSQGKVVQSRGLCNSNTEYHDRIVGLVNANAYRFLEARTPA